MAKIDLTLLRRDVQELLRRRSSSFEGRRPTGAMAVVRDNLDAFRTMRAGGATWVQIAEALANQGVTQGDGDRITAKRLTALIHSVARQAKRRSEREAKRASRADLVGARLNRDRADASPRPRLLLCAELQAKSEGPAASPTTTEEDIRRESLAQVRKLLKPNPEKKD